MDKDDNDEDYLPTWNPSTTDNEENDETEDPIDPDKPSPSDVAKIETDLQSLIVAVPIVAIKAPVFPSDKVHSCLSSKSISRKPSSLSIDYITPKVDIDGRYFNKAIISEKSYFILADR